MTLIDFPAAAGGGAEVLAHQLTVGLDPERFDRTLCVLRWRTLPLEHADMDAAERALSDAGVRLLALERRSRWDLAAWRPLIRLLRSGEVDLLHSHKFGPNVWGALLRILAGVPVFVAHEHTWSYVGKPLRRLLDRQLIARAADAFVAVSSEDRRRMIAVEHVPERRIELVPNGIPQQAPPAAAAAETRARLGIAADAPVVGTVAILRAQKTIDVLIRAAARLRDLHPGLRVLIVGEGPERERLQRLVAELGLTDTVTLLGFRVDIPDLLCAFDVAVSCSAFEGSPLAVLEYMAAGLPIVATAVGGVPDLIDDGRHGLLVPAGDPGALADAVHRLLAEPELSGRLAAAARERQAREFTVQRTTRRVEGLYERLLTRRGRGLRVEPLEGGLESARERWTELAQASESPFATYEWGEAWWRTFGGDRDPLVLGCRRADGRLVAMLPLYVVRRGPLRVARFIGHGLADELGPVCEPDERPAALAALRRAADDGVLPADLVVAERIVGDDGAEHAFDGTRLNVEANPAVATAGLTWEGFLASSSRNFREQVRRRERALARDRRVVYRLTDDPERLDDDLSTLFGLHERRWGRDGSGALAGRAAEFHRRFAREALRRGWLRLWTLEVDDVAVAAWYGMRYAGREWYYQSGRDPAWDRSSIGFVLLAHTLRAAMEDGVSEYRLLRGDESYKSRFATHDHPLVTSVAGASAIGRAAAAAVRALGPGRPLVRAALKRGAG